MIGPASIRRPRTTAAVAVAIAATVFVLWWFQPQKLLIERGVTERRPPPASETLARGDLRSLAHRASGHAALLKLEDGSRLLRLEDLAVENGPDLRVYLSGAPADSEASTFDDEFVDLGALKGNTGDQNYRVPADSDPAEYRSVVIWCRRFGVGFAVAPL